MATDSVIPFDLRDFHAIDYPNNLSILGMESFFTKISKVLKEKFEASQSESYVPFLGHVIVDVISPEKREVGPDQLVLKRLEEMNSTLERALTTSRMRELVASSRTPRRLILKDSSGVISAYLPKDRVEQFSDDANKMFEIDEIEHSPIGNEIRARLRYSGCTDVDDFASALQELVSKYSGRIRNTPQVSDEAPRP